MASPREPHSGRWPERRASASFGLLALALGLGGCFQDHVMFEDDDDGPVATTDEPDSAGSTGAQPATTAAETGEPSTGAAETSGGVAADESTSGSDGGTTGSTGPDDDDTGDSSTGIVHDESSGGVPVLGVDELQPGDLVVTEVMWNPHCGGDACEWIEVYNATASPVNLLDLYVQDIDANPANQGRVTVDLVVEPGGVAVITRGVSFWPYDFTPGAVYGPNPGLNNDGPEAVVVLNSTGVLDETAAFFLDTEEGVAWSLSGSSLDAVSNDNAGNWCASTGSLPTLAVVESGSPGELNEGCA